MKFNITTNSEIMVNFFVNNNSMKHLSSTPSPFISTIYADIEAAYKWVESEKEQKGANFYNLSMSKIKLESEVPMPKSIPSGKYIGENIFAHVKKTSIFKSIYMLDILGKKINIYMTFEKKELSKKWKEPNIQKINTYIENMAIWLHIASKYTTLTCAPTLDVFIYLSSLEKRVPDLDEEVISAIHVNTGVTSSCPITNAEIVVYRHEEWFKVFIHESYHSLGLDFSSMQVSGSESKLRETFYIPTPILLFEAYTEFWARVMNVLIFSFRLTTTNKDEFEKYATFMLDYERVNSLFQMVKVLDHMNLEYSDLHTDATLLTRYKENTNVFVYYVITSILLSNYPMFLKWCGDNNSKLLQFEQTEENQIAFCTYIQSQFNDKEFVSCINHSRRLLVKTIASSEKYPESNNIKFILNTLRMSLHEVCV